MTDHYDKMEKLPAEWRGMNWLVKPNAIVGPPGSGADVVVEDQYELVRFAINEGWCLKEDLRMGPEWRAELARRNKRRR